MTCRAMRTRLLPWLWERLEVYPHAWTSRTDYMKGLDTALSALLAGTFPAASVKFMTVLFPWKGSTIPLFVKCLESLPNLHTLEMGPVETIATPLKSALKGVKLPQIKTLIIPPAAHPLLRHCRNVEDVVCVVGSKPIHSEEFLRSLGFNQDSKVKQLAIPLVLWENPSRFVAACPRLTELTVIYPHPGHSHTTGTGGPLDRVGSARSAILELTIACKALPYFDTLQIVYFPGFSMGWLRQSLREEVDGMKDLAMDCLRKPETGRQGREGETVTLRVIDLSSERPRPRVPLDPVKVTSRRDSIALRLRSAYDNMLTTPGPVRDTSN